MTLHGISIAFLIASVISFKVIAIDVAMHRQKMANHELRLAITALYFGPLAIWTYFAFGCAKPGNTENGDKPYWQKVWIGITHCGAGCTFPANWWLIRKGWKEAM